MKRRRGQRKREERRGEKRGNSGNQDIWLGQHRSALGEDKRSVEDTCKQRDFGRCKGCRPMDRVCWFRTWLGRRYGMQEKLARVQWKPDKVSIYVKIDMGFLGSLRSKWLHCILEL